jgi:phage I-like protein
MLPSTKTYKAFNPVELFSLGLTNLPNIAGTYLGLNEADNDSPIMKLKLIALLAALGRPLADANATDEQLAAAINEAVPVATAAIQAQGELATAKTQLTAGLNEIAALNTKVTNLNSDVARFTLNAANERVARSEAVITSAINEGRLTEAQRSEFTGQLVNAADFAAKSKEICALKRTINTQSKLGGTGTRKDESAADTNTISAINEEVQKHMKETGTVYHDAYLAVKRAKPELFKATNG